MTALIGVRALAVAGTVLCVSGLTSAAQNGSPASDDYPKLPAKPGRELVIKVCAACHSPELAAEHQLDFTGWKTLVDQMATKGATATDEQFEEIVRYLAEAFPAP